MFGINTPYYNTNKNIEKENNYIQKLKIQQLQILTKDPRKLGPDAGPISLEHRASQPSATSSLTQAHKQGSLSPRSRHVVHKSGCAPLPSQPKHHVALVFNPAQGQVARAQGVLMWGCGLAPIKARINQPQRLVALRSNTTQGQVNPRARCSHTGVRAWRTPRATPPKLEMIIFSITIHSMSNVSR